MKELYYFLSISFVIILGWIAWKDYKTKFISLWSFYLLNLLGIFFLFYIDLGYAKFIMIFYLMIILILDILEYFHKLPKFISSDWMIGQTGVYDYWIYLFILVLFIDFLSKNFIYFYIGFSLSIIVGGLLGFFLTKKRYKRNIPLFAYAFFIIFLMIIIIFIHQLY